MKNTIRFNSYARAAIVGNPSDGYFGKTIAVIVKNFSARVEFVESNCIEIIPNLRDTCKFESWQDLVKNIQYYGYQGGVRLIKATCKVFFDYCQIQGIELPNRGFTANYSSDIPERLGLAGSSAIITACLKALMAHYSVKIPLYILPNLTLDVERSQLNIPAGLQDRVIQAYEGCVYMDFDKAQVDQFGYGVYSPIATSLLPPLYVAYTPKLSEGSEVFHNSIRSRWLHNDIDVVNAMHTWAELAQHSRDMILAGRGIEIHRLINENFDLRSRLYPLAQGNIDMVRAARDVGASANLAGSGGAIVGTYEGEEMYSAIEQNMAKLGAKVIKPIIQ